MKNVGRAIGNSLPLIYMVGGLVLGGIVGYRSVGKISAEEVLQRKTHFSFNGSAPLNRFVNTKKELTDIAELSSDGLISEEELYGKRGAEEIYTRISPPGSRFSYFTPLYSSVDKWSSTFTDEENIYVIPLQEAIKQSREVVLEQRITHNQLSEEFDSLTNAAKRGPISEAERKRLETVVTELRTYSDNGIGVKSDSELGRTMQRAIGNYQEYVEKIENDGTIYNIASKIAMEENSGNGLLGMLGGSFGGVIITTLPFFWNPPQRRENSEETNPRAQSS